MHDFNKDREDFVLQSQAQDKDNETLSSQIKDDKLSLDDSILDFNEIRQLVSSAQKNSSSTKTLTNRDRASIVIYIKDMVRYIKEYAAAGRTKLEYDCSKISELCFVELADRFKTKYPAFFVVKTAKSQLITVEWTGKNEV